MADKNIPAINGIPYKSDLDKIYSHFLFQFKVFLLDWHIQDVQGRMVKHIESKDEMQIIFGEELPTGSLSN